MSETVDLSPTILESLYSEALELADEVRAAFDISQRPELAGQDEDLARIALSCEALRTTTRMMHAIAWLLNQRAFLAGELTEMQLRHHGRLPRGQPLSEESELDRLTPELVELIRRTQRFHSRIARLDAAWSERSALRRAPIDGLRAHLGAALGSS